jgi:hypothetical protein
VKSWLTDGRGIAALITLALVVTLVAGCNPQSLACAKLREGQWVRVGDRMANIVAVSNRNAVVQVPGASFRELYSCEALR